MKEENNSLRQGVDFDPRVDYNEQQNGLCPPGKNNYYYLICAVSLSWLPELLLAIIICIQSQLNNKN